jgi:hypothetical protein
MQRTIEGYQCHIVVAISLIVASAMGIALGMTF